VPSSPEDSTVDRAGSPEVETPPTSTRDVWRAARARRKALRAEIRRFTQRSRRRRIIWWSAIGAVVLLVGGSVAAAYSPLFAVEKITVAGASTLDAAAVEAALSGQIGTPLALVDTSEVKAALLAFPLIETYALEARPPHDLTVRIVERTPIGVIRSDAGYTLVDAAGVALSTTSDQPAGQPLIDVAAGTDSSAFQSAGLVVRSLPADLRAQLTGVSASTADDVTLTLDSGLTVVWGSAEKSALKALVLEKALAAKPDATTVDVSSAETAVVG
jgi:cell division protein FtsQ